MAETPNDTPFRPDRQLRRRLGQSRRAIAGERFVRAFWPFATAVMAVVGLALFGAFAEVPSHWHWVAMLAAGLAVLATLTLGILRFRWPNQRAAAVRLDESAAPGEGTPLAVMTDMQASGRGDPFSRAVWMEHVRRAERAARSLKARPADLRVADRDPFALRLFAPVLLVAGLLAAGGDWTARLITIVTPPPAASADVTVAVRQPLVEAWATPPSYTGFDGVYLDRETSAYRLPVGTMLTIRVTDLSGEALLLAPGVEVAAGLAGASSAAETVEGEEAAEVAAGETEADAGPDDGASVTTPGIVATVAFNALGGGLHELRGTLRADGRVAIEGDGDLLADWQFTVDPDAMPQIAFDGDPQATFAGATEVSFRASDDYGVAAAYAQIVPEGGLKAPEQSLITEALEFALPLPITGDPREIADTAVEDLSEHPLAGGTVEITLVAEDGATQEGRSETLTITLPGRRFTHPLARGLVEQRRELALDFEAAPRVLDLVQAMTIRPQEVFGPKHGAYLTVRSAVRRLAFAIADDRVDAVAEEVTDLLWEAALALEGGDLDSALERLRAAEQALQDALENGTEEDIRRAMEEMRAAMEQYLQEFARQQMQQQQNDPMAQNQQQQQGQTLTQQDLQAMLDELQRRAESGLRDQARDMLSQLQQMLENLQQGQQQAGQGSPGQQAMQELQELIQRQRELSDRTFGEARRAQRQGQQGRQGQQQGQQGQQGQQQGQGQSQGQGQQFGQQPGQQPGQGQQGDGMAQGQQGQQPGQQPGQRPGQQPGGQNGQGPGGLSGEQRALNQMLEDLMNGLPGQAGQALRDALEGAGRSMDQAARDLDRSAPGDAVPDQLDALDQLNAGAEALAQQLEQQGQGQQSAQGAGDGEGEGRNDGTADPFDRPPGRYGSVDGGGTDVPDRALMDRARELLDELRRRSGEAERPDYELDYLDRLIERY
ncbi:MAG: TIGR02302 family protein [Pseudomonadota bacterium]